MGSSRFHNIVEALQTFCTGVDGWLGTFDKRLEPNISRAGNGCDIVETPDTKDFQTSLTNMLDHFSCLASIGYLLAPSA